MTKISFKISYHHGDAADGRLEMYDASSSLQGFARALSITTHALLNDGEIRRKGNRIEGAKLYIHPSRKGSFEELVTLVITNKEAIGTSVASAAFWDLVKWTWSKTLELTYEPQTPHVKRLEDRIEPFIGEMEETLEAPLEQAHRPIRQCDDMTIVLKRRRVGQEFKLDSETLKSVSLKTENDRTRGIVGNVTRYNILSGFGRFYDDQIGHTVSFKLQDSVTSAQKQMLTWSMHHAQGGSGGKIELEVQRVMSAKGAIKRYLVHSASLLES